MNAITILLATYNGERYLEAQLESLFKQKGWTGKILARDDGSSDRTVEILRKYPERIEILPTIERLGVVGNFSKLLEYCREPYMMFCDQDDVWKDDKVQVTFDEMKRLEAVHGLEMPLLVHTDLVVVDGSLNEIAPSYWKYACLYPKKSLSLNRLLMQNVVTGCTVMVNQALAKAATPIPPQASMHDWWAALVASAIGKIGYVDQATILYRQHHKNTLGAQSFSLKRGMLKLFSANPEIRAQKQQAYEQAEALKAHISLNVNEYELTQKFLSLRESNPWNARLTLLRYHLLRQGFIRNAATFLLPNR